MVWMNYFLNIPATMPLEVDILAIHEKENTLFALAFETKNRNEKNLPTIDDCKYFKNKLKILTHSLNQQKQLTIYGIYFSANGFSDEVEQWLHDQGILTIDLDTWKQ